MTDLPSALAALDAAIAVAGRLVEPGTVAPYAAVAGRAVRRHAFLGETVVVALAGGTGSGKSSLLNALAGEAVAPVTAVRPTTAEPLAWIPVNPEPGVVRLLDDLGVSDRVGHTLDIPFAVLDLPDFDSVELNHRATVEALLPQVDAIVWVLDPQKYSDRLIHRHYLAPLAGYQDQFLFVLNQVDRLERADLDDVLADLKQRLAEDGISSPTILTMAARPPGGPPVGVDRFMARMQADFEAKRVVIGKLREDVRRAGEGLAALTGADAGRIDLEGEWAAARRRSVATLSAMTAGAEVEDAAILAGVRAARRSGSGPIGRLGGMLRRSALGRAVGAVPGDEMRRRSRGWAGRGGLDEAVTDLSGFVRDASLRLGGPVGAGLRSGVGPGRIEADLRGAVEGALAGAGDPPAPKPARWWSVAGVLQYVLFASLVAGLAWLWADPTPFERGSWPVAALLVVGAGLSMPIVAALVTRGGRRRGREAARQYRGSVEEELSTRIQHRIGIDVAQILLAREELRQRLADVARLTRR